MSIRHLHIPVVGFLQFHQISSGLIEQFWAKNVKWEKLSQIMNIIATKMDLRSQCTLQNIRVVTKIIVAFTSDSILSPFMH